MRIAIAGYGVEGRSSYNYYLKKGHELTIVDERQHIDGLPDNAKTILGEHAFDQLGDFDMVVRSPSVSPKKLNGAKKVWSATNEFFAECPAPIVGVTGTKGKGTTASLIASILRKSDKTIHLVGNIGVPALDELDKVQPDDIVIYELSSFQLWDAEKSPHIAVVLMIESDHLDIHPDFDDYVSAKQNIVRFQKVDDYVIYNDQNKYSQAIGQSSQAQKVAVSSDNAAHILDGQFYYGDQKICSTDALRLPGEHNLINACAAIDAVWQFINDPSMIEGGLRAFDGLPHRLKFVREVNGVKYYDDSIATTAGSAIAAMKAFDQPKIIILGGSKKGSEYGSIAESAVKNNVKLAILIGDESGAIEQAFAGMEVAIINLGKSTTMREVVDFAQANAAPGDVVILSPACASFDMFKNYSDRGDQFITAVNGLKN